MNWELAKALGCNGNKLCHHEWTGSLVGFLMTTLWAVITEVHHRIAALLCTL